MAHLERTLRAAIVGVTHRRQRIRRTIEMLTGCSLLLWAVLLAAVDWSAWEIYQSPALSTMAGLAPWPVWQIGLVLLGGGLVASALTRPLSAWLIVCRVMLDCAAALVLTSMALAAIVPPVSASAPTLIVLAVAQVYAMLRAGLQ